MRKPSLFQRPSRRHRECYSLCQGIDYCVRALEPGRIRVDDFNVFSISTLTFERAASTSLLLAGRTTKHPCTAFHDLLSNHSESTSLNGLLPYSAETDIQALYGCSRFCATLFFHLLSTDNLAAHGVEERGECDRRTSERRRLYVLIWKDMAFVGSRRSLVGYRRLLHTRRAEGISDIGIWYHPRYEQLHDVQVDECRCVVGHAHLYTRAELDRGEAR